MLWDNYLFIFIPWWKQAFCTLSDDSRLLFLENTFRYYWVCVCVILNGKILLKNLPTFKCIDNEQRAVLHLHNAIWSQLISIIMCMWAEYLKCFIFITFLMVETLLLVYRYKGKSYRSTMRIVRTADQVSEFCRRVCERLQCCPNLFGPTIVSDKCPENCFSQTKTKYSEFYSSMAMKRDVCSNLELKWHVSQEQGIIFSRNTQTHM